MADPITRRWRVGQNEVARRCHTPADDQPALSGRQGTAQSEREITGDESVEAIKLWNDVTETFDTATTAINRLCSADLAAPSAYYWVDTQGTVDVSDDIAYGTQDRIFLTGEEGGVEGCEQ